MPISGIDYFEIKKLETIETALPLNFTSGEGLDLSRLKITNFSHFNFFEP
jgi:hypothetical protein